MEHDACLVTLASLQQTLVGATLVLRPRSPCRLSHTQLLCSALLWLRSHAGARTCDLCPQGTYVGIEGASLCKSCPIGTYSLSRGAISASTCLPCPAGSTTIDVGASSIDQCVPQVGHFVVGDVKQISSNATVLPCPSGFNCTRSGVVGTPALPVSPGFWRATAYTTNARPCFPAERCVGGVAHEAGALCTEGHHGPLCSVCDEGYGKVGGLCQQCPEDAVQQFWLAVLFFVGVAVVVIGVAYFVYYKFFRIKHTSDAITRFRRAGHAAIAAATMKSMMNHEDMPIEGAESGSSVQWLSTRRVVLSE